jgi:hypothetical protein
MIVMVSIGQFPIAVHTQSSNTYTLYRQNFDQSMELPIELKNSDVSQSAEGWNVKSNGFDWMRVHSGSNAARFSSYSYVGSSARLLLDLPLHMTMSNEHIVSFYMYHDSIGAGSDTLQVEVSLDQGATWSAIGNPIVRHGSEVWTQHQISLAGVVGDNVWISLLATSKTGYETDVFVDDLEVECSEPVVSDVDSAISSGQFNTYYAYLQYKINNMSELRSLTTSYQWTTKLNENEFRRDLAHLTFLTKYSPSALNQFTTDEAKRNFVKWLFQNPEIMNTFIDGGDPRDGRTLEALRIWENIWRTDDESRSGIYLTLAMATALDHAGTVDISWYHVGDRGEAVFIDPLSRYMNFKNAHAAGKLFPVFDTLDIWHMRSVVDAWLTDADLDWARETYSGPHSVWNEQGQLREFNTVYTRSNMTDAGYELEYKEVNATGGSVFEGAYIFYGPNATLQTVLKIGGVCGAIAKYGSSVAQAFGIPAMPVGQPGHAAAIHNSADGVWGLHNDIFGIGESTTHGGIIIPWNTGGDARSVDEYGGEQIRNFGPAYMLLYEDVVAHSSVELNKSERLRLLANELKTTKFANEVRHIAKDICPLNIQIWRDEISSLKEENRASQAEWNALNSAMISTFANHPRAMAELLTSMESQVVTGASEAMKSNYVQEVFTTYEAITNPQQMAIRDPIERSLPDWMRNYIPAPTIEFDFAGDHAGELIGFTQGMSISIDGGKSYLAPGGSNYKLSIREVNSLNPIYGIWVRNKFSRTNDINKMAVIQVTPNQNGNANVTGNDTENTLTGIDQTMEFTLNNGKTWTTYNGSNLPDLTGDLTLLVRKQGNGLVMPGKTVEITYTALQNIALHKPAYSSTVYSYDYAASKAFDGVVTSYWLSGYPSDNTQWIYVDLEKSVLVNAVKLNWWNWNAPYESYGYAKSYKIQVATQLSEVPQDSDWTDVYVTSNGNGGIDNISFDAIQARYVRLISSEVIEGYNWSSLFEFEVYDGSITPTVGKTPGVKYLSDMSWSNSNRSYEETGFDMSFDYLVMSQRLMLQGTQYFKGIGTHADSIIQYKLEGKYAQFSSDIGMDQRVHGIETQPIIFEVIVDTTTKYKSNPITTLSAIEHIDIDVTGAQWLTLKIYSIGDVSPYQYADWANAYLTESSEKPEAITDISNHWAKTAIEHLLNRQILVGYGTNNFLPNQAMTRAEFVSMIVKAYRYVDDGSGNAFDDVQGNHWYDTYISAAYQAGIVSGYRGRFRPRDAITREECLVVLMNVLTQKGTIHRLPTNRGSTSHFNDYMMVDSWAQPSVEKAIQAGIINGYRAGESQQIRPLTPATRAEAATMLYKTLFAVIIPI